LATKAWLEKSRRPAKFSTRNYHRCRICGRARAYMGRFGMCRMCFRERALRGLVPGVRKASW
jgi:small subunit ribosomal protein S14